MKAISLLSLATVQAVALANSQPLHERLHSPSFTILSNNTLEPTVERFPSFLLLNEPKTQQEAATTCNALHEKLVQGEKSAGIGPFLSAYQAKANGTGSLDVWLSKENGKCYRFSQGNSSIDPAPCENRYQGLCTNTAPFQRAVEMPPAVKPISINTTQGLVRGFRDRLAARFQGIPYAKPPVGARRLQDPERMDFLPTTNASGYDATTFKPICPVRSLLHLMKDFILTSMKQDLSNNPGVDINMTTSEDCLYLNVYTPTIPVNGTGSLPVLVWIHGGSYYYGGSSFPYYLGMNVASRQSMVVVSLNYRLGALGWLTDFEHKGSTGTNQAMRDQIMALQWVRDHISSYGGDPNKVTILGHSAGGTSVMSHIQSPASRGLFRHAWVESGNTLSGWQRPQIAKALSALFLDISGCLDYECVKFNITEKQMVEFQDKLFKRAQEIFPRGKVSWIEPFRPFIDGDLVTEDWDTGLNSGRFNQVPTVISYNREDYGLFLQENATFEYTPANFSDSAAYLSTFLLGENRTQEVLNTPELGFTRSLDNLNNIDNQLVNFTTNYWYRCNGEIYASGVQSHVRDTWELTWEMNVPQFIPGRICGTGTNRICHGSELSLIFGSARYNNNSVQGLSEIGYWEKARSTVDLYADFVRYGKLMQEDGVVYSRRGNDAIHNVLHWDSKPTVKRGGVNWDVCAKMEQMQLYDRLYYPYLGPARA